MRNDSKHPQKICRPLGRSFVLFIGIALSVATSVEAQQSRRPVDACFIAGDRVLLVACQRSGEILALDADSGEIQSQLAIGGDLVAIEQLDDETAWAIDQTGNRLLEITLDGGKLSTGLSIDCVKNPVSVIAGEANQLLVAGLWSRQVTCVARPAIDEPARPVWTRNLNFSPKTLRLLQPENVVLAVDAFGSQIAYLDASTGEQLRQIEFYGHRIRGMVDDPDGKRLIVSHQMLNSAAQSSNNDIHWGMMVSNDLRWLDRGRVMEADEENFYKDGHIDPIGIVGQGGADPNDLVCTVDGIVIVPLGGANEVAIGHEEFYELARLPVGINPVAVAVDSRGKTGWVVNRLDDSLTQIDIGERSVLKTVRLSEDWTPTTAELGERLFHDASLAHDGWMSCSSCHPGGHAVNERADNLSDGAYTSPKRVISLLGRADTAPFGWIGADAKLEAQLQRTVRTTMQGHNKLTGEQVTQLTAFLDSLVPPPPVVDASIPEVGESIARGQAIFERQSCNDCHAGSKYTSAELYDVGLEDELGHTRFNPPSLLGVGQRGPRYFHDLRAESLEAVFTEHKHTLDQPLSQPDLEDLLTFLRSL
ncbi:Di-heme cytochrome c peroxidase [Rosistilla ulvae]|uniref:Di-heme cytochrome c peroxidase n=1 Tax=Rosistilla ulvae TaxID=1930277 RepID=A0A517M2W0_9BACT|nr:cytochrome c peroxidase [Rosistilla ulvae]QDS89204.1 Di-heme cytochrome c peroxidase [Rosistilla ulvae]